MENKYKFDRNRNRVKYCPCGKKNNNKFSPFVNFEKKGHCFSCDKTFFPDKDNNDFKKENTYKYKPPKPISYHNSELISQSGRNYKNNNFILFVKSLFGTEATKQIIKKYLIGTSKKWTGATVFWQIDNYQKVRHGKIMLFSPKTGKRKYRNEEKKEYPYFSSVRAELKLNNFELKQCLFGLHLINESESKSIGVVEGEKTAILMSLFKPEYTWLATGSKTSFSYEYLKPIKNYRIIAFPDKSEYNDWHNKAITLNRLGFKIQVSSWIETTEYKKGSDLADVLIEEKLYNTTNIHKKTDKEQSNLQELIPTSTETLVKKLASKNPNIIKLVKVFQLTDNHGTIINV